MKVPIHQLDAFADRLFGGNPAAVVLLDDWLHESVMQAIAAENNLSETAFVVPQQEGYALRWFTPTLEVDLCGHATMAAAQVLFDEGLCKDETVSFDTRSGQLTVTQQGDLLSVDLPATQPTPMPPDELVTEALGAEPLEILSSMYLMAVFEYESTIRKLKPDFRKLSEVDRLGVIVTAPAASVDFVSRFFSPRAGMNEDPVTGSAHCMLTPYWAARLDKTTMEAAQLSTRGGRLRCILDGDRVKLVGRAIPYLKGTIEI